MIVAKRIMNILKNNGFEVYFVGGYVRDFLLNKESLDVDLVTNASTDDMMNLFKEKFGQVDEVGKRFGVLIVGGIEVAQYRSETYEVISKPEIILEGTLEKDSERRDFTINSIYMDDKGNISDPQLGMRDIKDKVIRAVGKAEDRFKEDPSRIMRGIYLSAKLNFEIDKTTLVAMEESSYLLKEVPDELKGKIIAKAMSTGNFNKFLSILMDTGIISEVFPELMHLKNVDQNEKYHYTNAWDHTLDVVIAAENRFPGDYVMVLAATYHDMAKGLDGIRGFNREGKPNDLGHEELGSELVIDILLKFGFGKSVAERVSFLIKNHGVRIDSDCKDRVIVRWLKKISKELKNKSTLINYVNDIWNFVEFDAQGFNVEFKEHILSNVNILRLRADDMLDNNIFYVSELSVNGKDLLEVGIEGKELGNTLLKLVDMNITDRERSLNLISKWSDTKN